METKKVQLEVGDIKKKFLNDFKALLAKYNAEIYWECGEGSDTYGIFDSHIEVKIEGVGRLRSEYNGIDKNDVENLEKV